MYKQEKRRESREDEKDVKMKRKEGRKRCINRKREGKVEKMRKM